MFSVLKGAPFPNQNIHALKCCFQPALLPAAVRVVPRSSAGPLPSHFTRLENHIEALRCKKPAPREVFLISELLKPDDFSCKQTTSSSCFTCRGSARQTYKSRPCTGETDLLLTKLHPLRSAQQLLPGAGN